MFHSSPQLFIKALFASTHISSVMFQMRTEKQARLHAKRPLTSVHCQNSSAKLYVNHKTSKLIKVYRGSTDRMQTDGHKHREAKREFQ
jgi:hypothetical protein